MAIKIVSDSSCDLWTLKDISFETVPLTINAGERSFVDDDKLNIDEFLDYMKHYTGRSSTACPGVQAWLDSFEGADEIYVVCMTGTLSGTYNSALIAKDMFLENHPEAKIAVFDTRTTSCEQALFIDHLVSLINDGLSFDEISVEAPKYLDNSHIYFAFNSIHNLAENGRINKLAASTVSVLGLSILGTGTPEGTLATTGKCRGERKTIVSLYEMIINGGYCGGRLRICHIANQNLADHFSEFVLERFPNADIEITPARGLIAYYGETGGIIVAMDNVPPVNVENIGLLA